MGSRGERCRDTAESRSSLAPSSEPVIHIASVRTLGELKQDPMRCSEASEREVTEGGAVEGGWAGETGPLPPPPRTLGADMATPPLTPPFVA